MKNIANFSNNVFDLNILKTSEFIDMINIFINVINHLNLEAENDKKVTIFTIEKMIEYGIIQNNSKQDLEKILGEEQFLRLVVSINKISNVNINDYPILQKFNLEYRNKAVQNKSNNKQPTLIDLFCGAGGLSLGLNQVGFKTILANDIDKQALRTYNFNHPEVDGQYITMGGIENLASDIRNYVSLGSVDVVVGGPPCQGFSEANRQRLIDDPRNILYKYFIECIHQMKPKAFIMENVKGMKKVSKQVIDDINNNELLNYDIDCQIINAKYLGVPQNRERLIFIGIRKDISDKKNILANEIFEKIPKKNITALSEAIEDLKPLQASRIKNFTGGDILSGFIVDEKYYGNDKQSKYVDLINQGKSMNLTFNHKARYNNERDIEIYSRLEPGDKSDDPKIADIMPYKSRSHMFKDKYFKLYLDKPCKTITAHMKFDCNMYIHPTQARGLTPREAARIQSYPDDYLFLGAYTKTYQQIGNSVPPLMARYIGQQIMEIIK
ncbi:DNA cytosine methyltransferase [Macrococcus bovicus]|uniref:DNA cytosine methyltransferase n=1 Tax=Macrococcus bovicus TaxID=69968 RepID=UPI0025A62F9E|nr:DNA cytosine methyltransferase [Macrococcus bovicus]WJP97272.1 DNA cytosine methyltransferase [Macrococcus bovicus]